MQHAPSSLAKYVPLQVPCLVICRVAYFISKKLESRSTKTSKYCRHIALNFIAKMSKTWKWRHYDTVNFISTQIFVYDKFQLFSWQEALLLNCWNTCIAILRHRHMHKSCCPYDRNESMRFRILNNSVAEDSDLPNMIKMKKCKAIREYFTSKWQEYMMGDYL